MKAKQNKKSTGTPSSKCEKFCYNIIGKVNYQDLGEKKHPHSLAIKNTNLDKNSHLDTNLDKNSFDSLIPWSI